MVRVYGCGGSLWLWGSGGWRWGLVLWAEVEIGAAGVDCHCVRGFWMSAAAVAVVADWALVLNVGARTAAVTGGCGRGQPGDRKDWG